MKSTMHWRPEECIPKCQCISNQNNAFFCPQVCTSTPFWAPLSRPPNGAFSDPSDAIRGPLGTFSGRCISNGPLQGHLPYPSRSHLGQDGFGKASCRRAIILILGVPGRQIFLQAPFPIHLRRTLARQLLARHFIRGPPVFNFGGAGSEAFLQAPFPIRSSANTRPTTFGIASYPRAVGFRFGGAGSDTFFAVALSHSIFGEFSPDSFWHGTLSEGHRFVILGFSGRKQFCKHPFQ